MSITSRQLIQDRIEELRENTDFVFTLFESLIGYAIIAADFDGNVIAYNEGARQIYGYAPEEVIGKQSIEIFFPRDFIEAGKLQAIIDDLIENERYSYEEEKVRKNGERFPAQILFTLTKDKSGKVVGFIEIVADLTERKRAEDELKRFNVELESSRGFLAGILDSTVDAILTVDEDGVIQSVNKRTTDLFGYGEDELIGKEIDMLVKDTICSGALEGAHNMRGGGGWTEQKAVTKSGAMFDCEIAIKEILSLPEEATRFTVIIRDITERKRAENELKRFSAELESRVAERTQELESSKAFLAAILDSAVDAILTIDEHGVIQSVNKGTTVLLGRDEDDLLGMNLSELLHESYRSDFSKNFSCHLREEKEELA